MKGFIIFIIVTFSYVTFTKLTCKQNSKKNIQTLVFVTYESFHQLFHEAITQLTINFLVINRYEIF